MNLVDLYIKSANTSPTYLTDQLDKIVEKEDIERIERAVRNITSSFEKGDKVNKDILLVLSGLDTLIKYDNLLNQSIYFNEFKDKYGNIYIQARTSLKIENKTKWITAYVGKIEDYSKGLNDPKAIKKGQALVRQKIKKHFGL